MPLSLPRALRHGHARRNRPAQRAVRHAAAVVALALISTLTPAGVLTSPARAIPIEGYPTYQPQSRCSPAAKLGTKLLADWLQKKYAGSGSSGISRSCTASGTSEHKEGRAFDWRLDATSSRDRGYAQDFLERITATDRSGNTNALARRMGIMYLIWNDRIWSASAGYRPRAYLHAACSRVKGCSTTLRHRDHMHISLTRTAARGRTSWYVHRITPGAAAPKPEPAPTPAPKPTPKPKPVTKPAAKPKPKPAPKPATMPKRAPKRPDGVIDLRRFPYTRVRVPANGEIVETAFKLRAGVTYSVTAAGLYSWGGPSQVADAVCTWSDPDQAWVPRPRHAVRRSHGPLRLLVNGKPVFGPSCKGSHTYRTEVTLKHDRPLKLRVAGKHTASRGRITVVIGRKRARVGDALPSYTELTPAPTYSTNPQMGTGLTAETLRLPGTAGAVWTRGSLAPGARYRVTVSGVVGLGGHARSNGQCVRVRGTWYDAAPIDPRVPAQDHGQLYLNGVPFDGRSTTGCAGNRHVSEIVASTRGRLRLDLWDPLSRSDNDGELSVTVQRLTSVSTPRPARTVRPTPRRKDWTMPVDRFTVDPGRRQGTVSKMKLRRGQRLRVVVTGRFTSDGRSADASCVSTSDGWQRRDPAVATGQDLLNVWVDGQGVRWNPLGGGRPCSSQRKYGTQLVVTKPGPVRLNVFDLDHSDNNGTLEVMLRRLKG